MRPLPFAWPYSAVFWAVFFWAFGIESMYMRRALGSGGTRSRQDAGSTWTVVIVNYIGMFFAVLAASSSARVFIRPPRPCLAAS